MINLNLPFFSKKGKIKIPFQKELEGFEKIKKLAAEGKINATVEYSSDINDLINEGVMGSPAILIDGKVVKVGNPSEDELYKILGIK